jgi:2-succinyl-5-enolpyruvyl-6-hydroxy-3-cyclohexene-1-carboxylate synthase
MNPKRHIIEIPEILREKGLGQVVIAPGSRNAPLIRAFTQVLPNQCHSIVDERSAGYYAMGMALKSNSPSAVITTSGTASLNLAPAVAEAFYLGVPMIIITADRPPEWIDQQDNQTIRQKSIYSSNCKAEFELPVEVSNDDQLWYANRLINEAFNVAVSDKPGPVHLNVPLLEPLYEPLEKPDKVRTISHYLKATPEIDITLLKQWSEAKRILIVCGQHIPDDTLNMAMNRATFDSRVAVLAEPLSNISGEKIINFPDQVLLSFQAEVNTLKPDLVVYFGGQVVSKRLKNYLRNLNQALYWYISPAKEHIDTFQYLSSVIEAQATTFFNALFEKVDIIKDAEYGSAWLQLQDETINKIYSASEQLPLSDLWAIKSTAAEINENDILFAGNSSIVRYLHYFPVNASEMFANRGTSGIDGCISTAAGIASQTEQKVVAVVGDLSFVYDSNGLWNSHLPGNLKIVVINNSGGGIFSLIDGPSGQDSFKKFFEAHHPVSLQQLSKAYGLECFKYVQQEEFSTVYNKFYNGKGAAVLEISTPADINPAVFSKFVKKLNSDDKYKAMDNS